MFLRVRFRKVDINPHLHEYSKSDGRWELWIRSREYANAFKQYFREYHSLPLEEDHDFDDWNYREFMQTAAYNEGLVSWEKRQMVEEAKELAQQWHLETIYHQGYPTQYMMFASPEAYNAYLYFHGKIDENHDYYIRVNGWVEEMGEIKGIDPYKYRFG